MEAVEDDRDALSAPNSAVLDESNLIPIATLDPSEAPPSTRAIKARVALLRPYSSSTRTAALLAAEPDSRLRRSKGQVWIHLEGSAARAVASSGVGINDTLYLKLKGSTWVEDDRAASTPGRGVDGALLFVTTIQLLIYRNDRQIASVDINQPESLLQAAATPAQLPRVPVLTTPSQYGQPAIWSSPAFLRHNNGLQTTSLRRSLNPFADEENDIDDRLKKRARIWNTSGEWTYTKELPSLVRDVSGATPGPVSPATESVEGAREQALTFDGDGQPNLAHTGSMKEQQYELSANSIPQPVHLSPSMVPSVDASLPASSHSPGLEPLLDSQKPSQFAEYLKSSPSKLGEIHIEHAGKSTPPMLAQLPGPLLQDQAAREDQVEPYISPNYVPSTTPPVIATPSQVPSNRTTSQTEETSTSPWLPPILTSLEGKVEDFLSLTDEPMRPPLIPMLEPLNSAALQLISPFPASPIVQDQRSTLSVIANISLPHSADSSQPVPADILDKTGNLARINPIAPVRVIDMTQDTDHGYPDFGLDGSSFSRPASQRESVEATGDRAGEADDERTAEAEDERIGGAEGEGILESKVNGSAMNDGPSGSKWYVPSHTKAINTRHFEYRAESASAEIEVQPTEDFVEESYPVSRIHSSPLQPTSADTADHQPDSPIQPAMIHDLTPEARSAEKPTLPEALVVDNVIETTDIAAIETTSKTFQDDLILERSLSTLPVESQQSFQLGSSQDSFFLNHTEADKSRISDTLRGAVDEEEENPSSSAPRQELSDDISAFSAQAVTALPATTTHADSPPFEELEEQTELATQQSLKQSPSSMRSSLESLSPAVSNSIASLPSDTDVLKSDSSNYDHVSELRTLPSDETTTFEQEMYAAASEQQRAVEQQILSEAQFRSTDISGDRGLVVSVQQNEDDTDQQATFSTAAENLITAKNDIETTLSRGVDDVAFQTSSTSSHHPQTFKPSSRTTTQLPDKEVEDQQSVVALSNNEVAANAPTANTEVLGRGSQVFGKSPRSPPYTYIDHDVMLQESSSSDVGLVERDTSPLSENEDTREGSDILQSSSDIYNDKAEESPLALQVSETQHPSEAGVNVTTPENLLVRDLSPMKPIDEIEAQGLQSFIVDEDLATPLNTVYTHDPPEQVIAQEVHARLPQSITSTSAPLSEAFVAPPDSPMVNGPESIFFDKKTVLVEQPTTLARQADDTDLIQPLRKANAKPRKLSNKDPTLESPSRRRSTRRRVSAVPEILGSWFESRRDSSPYIEEESSVEPPAENNAVEKHASPISRITEGVSLRYSITKVREDIRELGTRSDVGSTVRRGNEAGEDEDERSNSIPRDVGDGLLKSGVPTIFSASIKSPTYSTKPADKHDIELVGFRTSLSYYHRLSSLEQRLNYSSLSGDNNIDVLAVVISATKRARRATTGPKDFYTIFHVMEPSSCETATEVHVFRPRKDSLPVADRGDIILLRNFNVKSRKRECYLLSGDASAWCVWRFEQANEAREPDGRPVWARAKQDDQPQASEETKGAPVEVGNEEQEHARALRSWWESTQSEKSNDNIEKGDAGSSDTSPRSARTKSHGIENGE